MTLLRIARSVTASLLRRHWPSLVMLAVTAGLLCGAAIAAFSGARRTDTAFDRLLHVTDFPDGAVQLDDDPGAAERVRNLDDVQRVQETAFAVGLMGGSSNAVLVPVQASRTPVDFVHLRHGRLPDPTDPREVTISERMAEQFGLGVDDTFVHTVLTDAEWDALAEDRWDGSATGLQLDLRVVGVTRTPLDAVTDGFPTIVGTPAYRDLLDPSATSPRTLWVHVEPGREVDIDSLTVRAELHRTGPGATFDFPRDRHRVDDAVSVLVVGLVALGAIGAATALAVTAQLGARHADRLSDELRVLAGLGLSRRERRRIMAVSALPGAAVCVLVATTALIALSRLTPLGVARDVEPNPGPTIHLGALLAATVGVAVLVVGMQVMAARSDVGRAHGHRSLSAGGARGGRGAVGGPIGSVVVGLVRSDGPRSSRRLAAVGVGAGLVGMMASLTFAATLGAFVTDPDNWGGIADHQVELPEPVRVATLAALGDAPEISAVAEVTGGEVDVADDQVPAFWFTAHRGEIGPKVLQGRAPSTSREVALGPALAERLDLSIDDPVVLGGVAHTVVGVALGFGAYDDSFTDGVIIGGAPMGPPEERFTSAMVRFRPGVDHEVAAASLYGELEYGSLTAPVSIDHLAALRPLLPMVTALVSVVAIASLVHLAVATGSRARRELAVLRALGMARGQLVGAVVLATAVLVVMGTLVAVAPAVVVVRGAWSAALEATDLAAGLDVPVIAPIAAVGFLVLVVVVSAVVGRHTARAPVSRTLRAD